MSQSSLLSMLDEQYQYPDTSSYVDERHPDEHRHLWLQSRRQLEQEGVRSTPIGKFSGKKNSAYNFIEQMAARGLRLTRLEQFGRRNALDIQLRRIALSFENLPAAFDGYRILHLSDLHLDILPGLVEAMIEQVRHFAVDLCVMTGDYRAANDGSHQDIVPPMGELLRYIRAQDGCFATLGNHDDHTMVRTFEAQGLPVLVNETVRLRRPGATIHLTGLDDVNRFYTPMSEKALASTPAEAFKIALVHSPEMAQAAASHDYSLYLCGHTHGGQICLPGGRAIVTHLIRNRSFSGGLWQYNKLTGYTSTGAGVSGIPVRFFSRGEITLITLRRAHREADIKWRKRVGVEPTRHV